MGPPIERTKGGLVSVHEVLSFEESYMSSEVGIRDACIHERTSVKLFGVSFYNFTFSNKERGFSSLHSFQFSFGNQSLHKSKFRFSFYEMRENWCFVPCSISSIRAGLVSFAFLRNVVRTFDKMRAFSAGGSTKNPYLLNLRYKSNTRPLNIKKIL
jgi:hypothetical protein